MPLTFHHSYDQHQSLTKFQFTLEIKSHQLCHMNALALLPANYLTFHQPFSNLNVSEYFSDPQTCQCKESKFCYEPHGHVITGDLRVTENAKLRELVAKGPKYREPNRVNWKATETMFLESIDLYAKNWSKREQVELKYLSEWNDQLKELVADRISNLKGHFKSPKCKVLDQPDVKDTLHKLHANYVLVPADKAANNVIIVCKKYYLVDRLLSQGYIALRLEKSFKKFYGRYQDLIEKYQR